MPSSPNRLRNRKVMSSSRPAIQNAFNRPSGGPDYYQLIKPATTAILVLAGLWICVMTSMSAGGGSSSGLQKAPIGASPQIIAAQNSKVRRGRARGHSANPGCIHWPPARGGAQLLRSNESRTKRTNRHNRPRTSRTRSREEATPSPAGTTTASSARASRGRSSRSATRASTARPR